MSNFAGDNESMEKATQPALCGNNCGFFANPTLGGLCSKCHRDTQRQEENQKVAEKAAEAAVEAMNAKCSSSAPTPPAPAAVDAAAAPLEASTSTAAQAAGVATEPSPAKEPAAPAKAPSRCQQCRKKVGLTGFKCRCGLVFCGQHRYAEAHCCTFDYKTSERQKLAENNPLVQASKVQKL